MIRIINIANKKNPRSPFKVVVKSNKNLGICDFILPDTMKAPANPESLEKPVVAAYKRAVAEYKAYQKERSDMRSQLLNFFQGRQINSEEVCIHLVNVLYEILN